MICIGIDPGKDGALAILRQDEQPLVVPFDLSAYAEVLWDVMVEMGDGGARCCLEKVGPMPKQGVTSMFSFGENFGLLQGVLTAYRISYQLVPPRTWKAEFGLNSDKAHSVSVCRRLFPDVSLRRTDKCRKDHDGMAEALLMAEYARRRL